MLRENSTSLGRQGARGVFGQLLAQDQDGIKRRAQLVRHVREKFRFVLRREREFGSLLLQRAAGLLHFSVLYVRLRRSVLPGAAPWSPIPRLSAAARSAGLQLDRELL